MRLGYRFLWHWSSAVACNVFLLSAAATAVCNQWTRGTRACTNAAVAITVEWSAAPAPRGPWRQNLGSLAMPNVADKPQKKQASPGRVTANWRAPHVQTIGTDSRETLYRTGKLRNEWTHTSRKPIKSHPKPTLSCERQNTPRTSPTR